MSLENLNDRPVQADDLMTELAKLPLPPAEKLATYLKTNFGRGPWYRMTDEDFLEEAKALWEAIQCNSSTKINA